MTSRGSSLGDQPLADRLWGSGFLPSKYHGVKFRSGADPVLYLSNPPGLDAAARRRFLEDLKALNQAKLEESGDPEIAARIAQYEMAYRMQTSVPDLTDLSKEPKSTFHLYGPEARKPGMFAANCLLARRLAERGVRFIQLYHKDWDHHGGVKDGIAQKALETDRACMALIPDGTNIIELVIVLLEGGLGTNYLFNEIHEGSELVLRGPQGVFTLPDPLEKDLVRTRAKLGETLMKLELVQDLLEKRGYGEEVQKLLRPGSE